MVSARWRQLDSNGRAGRAAEDVTRKLQVSVVCEAAQLGAADVLTLHWELALSAVSAAW